MKKTLKIILVTLIMLGIILSTLSIFTVVFDPVNRINLKSVKEISIDEMNELTDQDKINYKTSQYIERKDTLYLIDLEGNTYKLPNASKRQLDLNLADTYFKQFFEGKKPSTKLTDDSYFNPLDVVVTAIYVIFYICLIYLLYKYMLKASSGFTKSETSEQNKNIPKIKFADVKGHKEAKRDIEFLLDFMKNSDKYKKMHARFPRGILLYGPPGTGKTLLAKALAGEAGVPIFTANGSDFIELYVGMGAKRVRDLFREAKKNAPCIIFIDEIDAVAQKRSGGDHNREHNQTLNALLACLDGFNGNDTDKDIIVLASTNRLDVLDPAIKRPGRFDKHIAIGHPDITDREEIAELYLKDKPLDEDVTAKYIAKQTYGFTGAMIDSLINEASLIAALKDKETISKEDLSDAMLKIITGGDKKITYSKDKPINELVALHEAGHALVYRELCKMPVPKVSIVPTTTGALGWTMTSEEENSELMSREDLENRVIGLYAGRASEQTYYKGDKSKVTTGASNDIEQATKYIVSMITKYGFNSEVGNINLDILSEASKIDISKLVYEKSNELYNKAVEFIEQNDEIIKLIAKELLEKETIDQTELDGIINR